jgi:transposase-like protein
MKSLQEITEEQIKGTGITVSDIRSGKKTPAISYLRHQIMDEAHRAGHGYADIGRFMNRHHASVMYGVGRSRARNSNIDEDKKALIIKRYNDFQSQAAIAREFGYDTATIGYIIQKAREQGLITAKYTSMRSGDRTFRRKVYRQNINVGKTIELSSMSQEILDWWINKTIMGKYETLMECVCDHMVELYYESEGSEK